MSARLTVIDPSAAELPEQNWEEIVLHHERFYRDQDAHRDWAETAKKSVDYFEGRQWSAQNLAKLQREGRPVLTINKLKPLVNLVLGYHLNNQTDRRAIPTNDATGTADMARVQSHVMKNISDQNDLKYVDTEVHLDGLLGGRGWWEIEQDYSGMNVFGECRIVARDPFIVYPDCDAQDYDPHGESHGRVSKVDWISVDEIEAWYGAAAAQRIAPLARYGTTAGMSMLTGAYGDEVSPARTFAQTEDASSGWKNFLARGSEWADTYRKCVRRLNIQHWVRTWRWCFVDMETGDRRWVPDHWTAEQRAKVGMWAHSVGMQLAMQRARTRRIRWTHIIGDTVVYDRWSPYERLTLVPFFPYFRRGVTQGMVESLLDVQDEINVRRAARLNIVMRASNSGWEYHKGTLSPQERRNLEVNGGRAGFVLEYDLKNNTLPPPRQITPQQSPVSIAQLEKEAESDMQEIAGINRAALGQSEGANTSGRAVLARQQQTVVGLEGFRSNWHRSVRLTGKAMLACVQGFYTEPRLIRVVGKNEANPVSMLINQRAAEGVINDVTQGKYDVQIDETSLTESFLDAQFGELLQLAQLGMPIPDDILIDASSIGRKEEVRMAVAAARAAGPPPGAEPPPKPGTQPPAPPQAPQAPQPPQPPQRA